jgi:hypothetical protein
MKFTWLDSITTDETEIWCNSMSDSTLRIQKFYSIDKNITILIRDMYCDFENSEGYIYDYEVSKC